MDNQYKECIRCGDDRVPSGRVVSQCDKCLEMNKIMSKFTKERVIAAYKATNLRPTFQYWGDGETCGCAVTAVLKHEKPEVLAKLLAERDQAQRPKGDWSDVIEIGLALGVYPQYMSKIIDGFDSTMPVSIEDSNPMYNRGKEIRDAVREDEELKDRIVREQDVDDVELEDDDDGADELLAQLGEAEL